MAKIKSLDDLIKAKNELKAKMDLREKSNQSSQFVQIRVAMATCGIAAGAKKIMEYFLNELEKRNIDAIVTQTGCMGYCYAEPTVEVLVPGRESIVIGNVDHNKVNEIIDKYIKNGELIDGIIPVTYKTIES